MPVHRCESQARRSKPLYETCVALAGAVGRFRYGSGMGQIGEDRQATPDVVVPVKGSPLASFAPYYVAPPLPRASVAGKPWKEAGRSHLAAAARVEASSSTVVRFLGVNRSPQARQLRERAKSARRTARALAPLASQGWVVMHDRVVAGTSVVLDHVLVGPAGLVVVQDRPVATSAAYNVQGWPWADGVPLNPEREQVRWATLDLLLQRTVNQMGPGWHLYAYPFLALHTRTTWAPDMRAPACLVTPSQLPWAIGTFSAHLAPMHVTALTMIVEVLCPPAPLTQP